MQCNEFWLHYAEGEACHDGHAGSGAAANADLLYSFESLHIKCMYSYINSACHTCIKRS